MSALDIPRHRLYSQQIAQGEFELPDQIAAWLGAMQAQDYPSVKWGVGLRCQGADAAAVERAFVSGDIVRTWLMRGTLQLAAASDVRWMLALLGPRIISRSARRYAQLELDDTTFTRSFETLSSALEGGNRLTRSQVMLALEQTGITAGGPHGYHILRRAGLEGLICYGPFQGRQETFVLLDEWVPHRRELVREEALAELAGRYFAGHGPAALQDFVWWSGLLVGEARAGLDSAKTQLHQETIDGQAYWMVPVEAVPQDPSPTAYLLPAYDEYYLGYKAREAVLDPGYDKRAVSSSGVFRPMIVMDGQVVGIWKQEIKEDSVTISLSLFRPLTEAEEQALDAAAKRYGAYLGLPTVFV
jgi:hypothetical protein